MKFCHEGFCYILQTNVLEPNQIERIVNIIGQIAAAVVNEEDVATQQTCSQLTEIMQRLHQNDIHAMQNAFSKLSPEAQHGINTLFF